MREELQEGRIEVGIKLLQIFFLKVLRTGHFVEFVVLACLQLLVHSLAQILYLGDIDGAEAHKSPYILFLDSVGIGELVVDDRELTVRDRELLVERLELIIELVELLVGLGEVVSCYSEFMSLSADVEHADEEHQRQDADDAEGIVLSPVVLVVLVFVHLGDDRQQGRYLGQSLS